MVWRGPEYYGLYQDDKGRDLHGMAQIIIAKHRKGATGDVLLTFRGEFTRFENPDDSRFSRKAAHNEGEVIGSSINGVDSGMPFEQGQYQGSSDPMPF